MAAETDARVKQALAIIEDPDYDVDVKIEQISVLVAYTTIGAPAGSQYNRQRALWVLQNALPRCWANRTPTQIDAWATAIARAYLVLTTIPPEAEWTPEVRTYARGARDLLTRSASVRGTLTQLATYSSSMRKELLVRMSESYWSRIAGDEPAARQDTPMPSPTCTDEGLDSARMVIQAFATLGALYQEGNDNGRSSTLLRLHTGIHRGACKFLYDKEPRARWFVNYVLVGFWDRRPSAHPYQWALMWASAVATVTMIPNYIRRGTPGYEIVRAAFENPASEIRRCMAAAAGVIRDHGASAISGTEIQLVIDLALRTEPDYWETDATGSASDLSERTRQFVGMIRDIDQSRDEGQARAALELIVTTICAQLGAALPISVEPELVLDTIARIVDSRYITNKCIYMVCFLLRSLVGLVWRAGQYEAPAGADEYQRAVIGLLRMPDWSRRLLRVRGLIERAAQSASSDTAANFANLARRNWGGLEECINEKRGYAKRGVSPTDEDDDDDDNDGEELNDHGEDAPRRPRRYRVCRRAPAETMQLEAELDEYIESAEKRTRGATRTERVRVAQTRPDAHRGKIAPGQRTAESEDEFQRTFRQQYPLIAPDNIGDFARLRYGGPAEVAQANARHAGRAEADVDGRRKARARDAGDEDEEAFDARFGEYMSRVREAESRIPRLAPPMLAPPPPRPAARDAGFSGDPRPTMNAGGARDDAAIDDDEDDPQWRDVYVARAKGRVYDSNNR